MEDVEEKFKQMYDEMQRMFHEVQVTTEKSSKSLEMEHMMLDLNDAP